MSNNNIKNLGVKRNLIGFDEMKKVILPYTVTFLSLVLLLCTLIAYINECNKDKYLPYIVSIDRRGSVIYSDTIDKNTKIPKEAIADFACSFIENLYTKGSDSTVAHSLIKKIYASIDLKSNAKKVVDAHYKSNDYKKYVREVFIQSVSELDTNRYQIDFNVNTFTENIGYKAILSIKSKKIKVNRLETLRLNPLGLFIDDISISKRIS